MRRTQLGWAAGPNVRAALLAGCSVAALAGAPALAGGPTGGSVASGTAAISATPDRTTISQSTNRAVIDWQSFDVGAGHTVEFAQPGRSSATLNRVTTGGRSTIQGAIEAPGTVIIQNTAGVLFTDTARIDVGGLVATSQQVDAARFQDTGGLRIGGGEAAGASVVNEGQITVGEAGLAALVGGHVENAGAIVARRGTVLLASGRTTAIDLTGDGMVQIAVEGDATTTQRGVSHSGTIDAQDGRVVISAGAAAQTLDSAINTTGAIRANSMSANGGRIEITGRGQGTVRIAGAVQATGATRGGDITATGARVEIADGARIDASGAQDGGRVHMGGDWRGLSAPRPRADNLVMSGDARIAADGGTGQGGEVVLWADRTTRFDGTITATGTDRTGEVRTAGLLQLSVGADARVETGTADAGGLWRADSRAVVIDSGAGPEDFFINPAPVTAALDRGTRVNITNFDVAPETGGNIAVRAPVRWDGDGFLLLSSAGTLLVGQNSPIEARGDGALTLSSRGTLTVDANVRALGAGTLQFNSGQDVRIGGGPSGNRIVSTNSGDFGIIAGRNVIFERQGNAQNNVQVFSDSGQLSVRALTGAIRVTGGDRSGRWVRIGRAGSSSDIVMSAPEISIRGGGASDSFAEVVTGAGGSITMTAGNIEVRDGAGSPGRISALFGAPLTLLAETQSWDGLVQTSTGTASNGGAVTISGAVTASVAPLFRLAADNDFTLLPETPRGAGSSYSSDLQPLVVTTAGSGTIDVGGPITVPRLLLQSAEGVTLGSAALITATGGGAPIPDIGPDELLVIAAGRLFRNESEAGTGVLVANAEGARWLLYVDGFDGLEGPEPETEEFDLYGRFFADAPPAGLGGFGGDRLVFGEAPVLTLTAGSLEAPVGTPVDLGFTVEGFVRGDGSATALLGDPTVTSAGAPVTAPAGLFATQVVAESSGQGYVLNFVDGTLTRIGSDIPDPVPPGGTPPALASALSSLDIITPGAPPLTPGDSAFRTTLAEVPTSRDSTFALTFSLGEIVQLVPAGLAGDAGFVPAAGGANSGFVPASGGEVEVGNCVGPISIGDDEACGRVSVIESFWTTAFPEGTQ